MKEIQLTQGKVALVDDEDFEYLNQWKWCAQKSESGGWYATSRMGGGRGAVGMHRVILGLDGPKIDHRDGDGLNNQRYNLRVSTSAQNSWNRGKNKNNKTGYKGVRQQEGKYYIAEINREYLGCFHTPEDAARAYDKAAKERHGDFANLNFPNE